MSRLVCATLGAALLIVSSASAAVIARSATTATYTPTLAVGPVETMYTQAELKAKHPTSGEVMVGGAMGGGMSMGGANRRLEVHVASRATGKVVTNVTPSITLADENAMGMGTVEKVNATAVDGIGEGAADLHYGDNIELTPGHVYKVVVTVKGEKATFSLKA